MSCPPLTTSTWTASTSTPRTSNRALAVNADEWRQELPLIEEWFEFVGDKLPTGVRDEFEALKQRLAESN